MFSKRHWGRLKNRENGEGGSWDGEGFNLLEEGGDRWVKRGYSVRMAVKRGWAVAEMKVGRYQKRSSENVQTTF